MYDKHTEPQELLGEFEKFKTTSLFDGTERNPHWLNSLDPTSKGT